MKLDEIRDHWRDWAQRYGTDLRATTKGTTAKIMEIDALSRTLSQITGELGDSLAILEAGCGNGKNLLSLVDQFPHARFSGFDLIDEMIDAANTLKSERADKGERLEFYVGDVLKPDTSETKYDIVFTDRCLINLNTLELQKSAISALINCVKPGGYFLMIENSFKSYNRQNLAREAVGLPARTPDKFNLFFDEDEITSHIESLQMDIKSIEDFISLHDLILYVLLPMTNGGKIEYDHPLVAAATQLNTALSAIEHDSVGMWGQNRLYICKRSA